MLHYHNYLSTWATPWYEPLMISCIHLHKHSWRLDHPQPAFSFAWHMIYLYENWTRLIICHVCTIMKHSFPIAVPLSIWTIKEVSQWLQHSQLCWYTIIDFIFNTIFNVKAKADISLHSPTCCYILVFFYQGCPFGKLRHFWAALFECNKDTLLWFEAFEGSQSYSDLIG